MSRPTADIEGCRQAHVRLVTLARSLDQTVIRQPSLLSNWTVAHVLSHLARNAEAMSRRIDGASRGEMVDQYIGGVQGRAAEIEAGARHPVSEVVSDVVESATRLDDLFTRISDDLWPKHVRAMNGDQHPIAELPFRRWREVEVHLLDLGAGATAADWPDEFAERALPSLLAWLPDRADSRALVAWLFGRGPAPELPPWG